MAKTKRKAAPAKPAAGAKPAPKARPKPAVTAKSAEPKTAVKTAEPEPKAAPAAAKPAETPVRIENDLTIFHAAELREILAGRIAKAKGRLVVDFLDCKEADDAGMQIVIAAAKSAERRGVEIAFEGAPPALRNFLRTAGVENRVPATYRGE